MDEGERFPRPLTDAERVMLQWVLPEDSPGYRSYRGLIAEWPVAGAGRRGEGNYILAAPHERIDITSPLPPVIAMGEFVGEREAASVVVRERVDNQLEFEITPLRAAPGRSSWRLSSWKPGEACPQCGSAVREVHVRSGDSLKAAVVFCRENERVWVHNVERVMNHPIPHTGFYTDLMLVKNIRDPKLALDFHSLFTNLDGFSDNEIVRTFVQYNRSRARVDLGGDVAVIEPNRSWLYSILKFFMGRR